MQDRCEVIDLPRRADTEFVWPRDDNRANEAILALQVKVVDGDATVLDLTTLWLMSELKRLKFMEVYEATYDETMAFLNRSEVPEVVKPDIYVEACVAIAGYLGARTYHPELLDITTINQADKPTLQLQSDIVS